MKLLFQKKISGVDIYVAIAYNGDLKIGSKWAWERKHMQQFNPTYGFYYLISAIDLGPNKYSQDTMMNTQLKDGAIYCSIDQNIHPNNEVFSDLLLNPIEVSVLRKEQKARKNKELFID